MTPDYFQIWSELAAAAQTGDKRAYSELLHAVIPFIRQVLAPQLANPDWIEDVTQEVLISVHKSLHTWSPERPFKPWLQAIIQYRKADYLRQHYNRRLNKTVPVEEQTDLASDVTNPEDLAELKDLEQELSKLPAVQRQIFEMIKIQGFSAQEVAEKTGMSISAVKVSAHRTLARLRENLG